MSTSTLPPGNLSLHGLFRDADHPNHRSDFAISFTLADDLLQDLKRSAASKDGIHFLTGNTPKIRLGKRTIDLTISNEVFRRELYSASTDSLRDLNLIGLVDCKAELNLPERKQSVGTDAALTALQNSLASYQQEKQAKAVNINSNVVAEPKNRREAARDQKQARRRNRLLGSQHASSSAGDSATPRADPSAPTSLLASDSAARKQAIRTPLTHLLAMKPLSLGEIMDKTCIPKDELEEALQRIGKQEQGKWQLTDRTFKELDVWSFGYSTQDDRQTAIDNAIRAYDRLRLGKEEKIWQSLLPKEDRDKGIVLSKLHLGPGGGNRTLTPNLAASPLLHGDGAGDNKVTSAANTPRLGPSSTPKLGAGKNESAAFSKRLLSKDPKKARAMEEAKEKKRKERDAAKVASDTEGGKPARKKQTVKANNTKALSAEIVQNSSDESEDQTKESRIAGGSSYPTPRTNDRKPAANASARPKAKPFNLTSIEASGLPARPGKPKVSSTGTPKIDSHSSGKSVPNPISKRMKPAPLEKATPTGLSAPSSQHRPQLSPQKPGSRPPVPSPLGAARPRVASDVSDRGAVGIQRVRQGGETPKGLGITNGIVRKRHDTVMSSDSPAMEKMNGDHRPAARRAPVDGTSSKPAVTNGAPPRGVKRKPIDSPVQPAASIKHRKTESSSSSQKSHSSSSGTDMRLQRANSSDSVSSILNDITYGQGVGLAQKFSDVYYPQYAKLYDEQLACERRGETVSKEDRRRLWDMHRRLEQMKREIKAASLREHLDES